MNIRIDPNISWGNILVAISMAAAMLFSWATMDSRLRSVEITLEEQKRILENQVVVVQLLSLNVKQLSTLAEIYVPRIEELSRESRDRRMKP